MSILKSNVLDFISTYKLFENDTIQLIQLQHRLELVEAFHIKPGMKILEIGCGQGDTTVALANAVGDYGMVTAIDISHPDYGAPITLGQAAKKIEDSSLGKRITFHFETDFLLFEPIEQYDAVVLSHCSWYFKHANDLLHYFKKIKNITNKLCFAEWDLNFTSITQRSHFCAVTLLALHSNLLENDGNIQNLFHKQQIEQLLYESGFSNMHTSVVDASYLQDGTWEQEYANSIRSDFNEASPMIQVLANSYYEIMNFDNPSNTSLNSFVICTDPS